MKLFHKLSTEEREFYLELFEESNMTAKAFCSEHDIAYRTLIEWRHRQRKKNRLEQVEEDEPQAPDTPKFVEVDCTLPVASDDRGGLLAHKPAVIAELDLPAGITLRIFQPQQQS